MHPPFSHQVLHLQHSHPYPETLIYNRAPTRHPPQLSLHETTFSISSPGLTYQSKSLLLCANKLCPCTISGTHSLTTVIWTSIVELNDAKINDSSTAIVGAALRRTKSSSQKRKLLKLLPGCGQIGEISLQSCVPFRLLTLTLIRENALAHPSSARPVGENPRMPRVDRGPAD